MRNVTCKTTPVSRGKGQSAVAGAAYRAGENIKARGQGIDGGDKWFRYSNRALVVRDAFILTPEDAPAYATDRAELWNTVEEMETHKNARLGRELQLGLAYELSHEDQRALVEEFAKREFVERGFVVDVAIHNYGRTLPAIGATDAQAERIRELAENGVPFIEREEAEGMTEPHMVTIRNRDDAVTGYKLYQPHAHVRATPRTCEGGEFVKDKYASRELNKHETAMRWRYEWPELQNQYLERAGSDARVTSTSTDEDQFPNVRFLSGGQSHETHNMTQRADAMPDASRNKHDEAQEHLEKYQEFNDMHNDALLQAAHDAPHETDDDADRDASRNTTWWRNMSSRFNSWRFDFTDKAQEWRERFAAQEWRLKSMLGWHGQEHDLEPPELPPEAPLEQSSEQSEPEL